MAKVKHPSVVDVVDDIMSHGVNKQLIQLNTNEVISGRKLIIKGKEVTHFGNCNYLGLERHPKVKEASMAAIAKEGIRLTMSRTYVSSGYYAELEELLRTIYDGHVVVAPSSTMLHLSAIPVLISRNDMVLMDQQVHASMIQAIQYTKANGVSTRTVRHSRYDLLESFIQRYHDKYEKVWYVLDGIYSMYGDAPDIHSLIKLLDKYPNFYLYVDDAHGTSWKGKYGRGYILDQVDLHPKMIMTVSLGKGFGTIGGVMVTKDPEYCRRVRNCGNTLIFSAPLSSGLLGASIASAKIHLTDELIELQNDLQDKIDYTNQLIKEHHLPLVREEQSPIFYIGLGLPKAAYNMLERLLNDGFLTNIGAFPAVSLKCAGTRFLATCHLEKNDIEQLMERISYHLPRVLKEENYSFKELAKSFDLPHFEELEQYHQVFQKSVSGVANLKLEKYKSIQEIDPKEWNTLMKGKGVFDVASMELYENTFKNNEEAKDNWDFMYYIVRDQLDTPIVAGFFTESLWKEDLLAPPSISQQLEEVREKEDPLYLISNSISLGCQAVEGEPLYIDDVNQNWKKALEMVIKDLWEEQEKREAELVVFRDMHHADKELTQFFMDKGFIVSQMPDKNHIKDITWNTEEEFLKSISYKSRKSFKKYVHKQEELFNVSVLTKDDTEAIDRIYDLYMNVKKVNFGINTFPLPKNFFTQLLKEDSFEMLKVELKEDAKIVAFFCAKQLGDTYYPMYLGIDYDYLHSHSIYRQTLYQIVKRARALDCTNIYLGFSANTEKHKFGAEAEPAVAFIQFKDTFKQTVIENMSVRKLDKHY